MLEGLSTNRRCETSAACLAADGRRFVIRYHSRTTQQPEKRLHPREAALLARAGLALATVYQDRGREPQDFGAERGRLDAVSALTYAGQVGQSPGSAVYFAVDTDFSTSQVRSLVLPYLRAAKAAFDEAGKGQAYLRIGVYGSGLTCRLARELPFVDFAWLAEATGWRESATFTAWHVRQHRNTGQTLCALGDAFQRCEAQDGFGQFQPVGFALGAGDGERRRVKAEGANLRHLPTTVFGAPITLLPQGHELQLLGVSAPGWLRVRTNFGGGEVIGHVAASRVEAAGEAPPVPPPAPPRPAVPAVSLRENHPAATRASTDGRAFPPGEPGRPVRDPATDAATRRAQLRTIADWLGVETSARYRRTPGATFCNVYAADYGYLSGAYLPRVWWTGPALVAIGQGQVPAVAYGDTVREMRADDLFAWLSEWGVAFGWRRVFDASALQAAANAGGVGVVCADRAAPGLPGHVTVVVPEDDGHRALRDADGNVTQPLQSQAGAVNRRYGSAGASWWASDDFRDRGFWVHD